MTSIDTERVGATPPTPGTGWRPLVVGLRCLSLCRSVIARPDP